MCCLQIRLKSEHENKDIRQSFFYFLFVFIHFNTRENANKMQNTCSVSQYDCWIQKAVLFTACLVIVRQHVKHIYITIYLLIWFRQTASIRHRSKKRWVTRKFFSVFSQPSLSWNQHFIFVRSYRAIFVFYNLRTIFSFYFINSTASFSIFFLHRSWWRFCDFLWLFT